MLYCSSCSEEIDRSRIAGMIAEWQTLLAWLDAAGGNPAALVATIAPHGEPTP